MYTSRLNITMQLQNRDSMITIIMPLIMTLTFPLNILLSVLGFINGVFN